MISYNICHSLSAFTALSMTIARPVHVAADGIISFIFLSQWVLRRCTVNVCWTVQLGSLWHLEMPFLFLWFPLSDCLKYSRSPSELLREPANMGETVSSAVSALQGSASSSWAPFLLRPLRESPRFLGVLAADPGGSVIPARLPLWHLQLLLLSLVSTSLPRHT